jgi:hypothetical protein
LIFLSSGYNYGLDLNQGPLFDDFFNPRGPLFKYPNMARIMEPDNFFKWNAFEGSKAQRAFKIRTLNFIMRKYYSFEEDDLSNSLKNLVIDKSWRQSVKNLNLIFLIIVLIF